MKVNPEIKKTLEAISVESVNLANSPIGNYKHARRFMDIYLKQLNDEERIFIIVAFFEMIHLRSIITDDNSILTIYNMKFRTIFFVFLLSCLFVILAAVLFKTNDQLNGIVDVIGHLFSMFSIGS